MTPTSEVNTLPYVVGDEVVVTLADDVEVFNLACMTLMPPALLPAWTIGRIVSRDVSGIRPAYVFCMRLRGMRCMFVADADRIEGLA